MFTLRIPITPIGNYFSETSNANITIIVAIDTQYADEY